jgi:hypothetical protein
VYAGIGHAEHAFDTGWRDHGVGKFRGPNLQRSVSHRVKSMAPGEEEDSNMSKAESFDLFRPLLEAGWFPGRRTDLSEIAIFYDANQLLLHNAARAFLTSFIELRYIDISNSKFKKI